MVALDRSSLQLICTYLQAWCRKRLNLLGLHALIARRQRFRKPLAQLLSLTWLVCLKFGIY